MGSSWGELLNKIYIKAREKRQIVMASFELTSRCNQQCKMCYVNNRANDSMVKAKELTAGQWIHLAEEARDAGLFLVTLTGGEIFLREDFKEIYEGICNTGLLVQLLSNGTLITPQTVKWLTKIPPLKIAITLYGASKETCARITGYEDSYERTVRAIDLLLDAGIKVEIRTTVVRGNMADMEQLSEFAYKRRLVLGIVNYISPRREAGCLTDPEGLRLAPDELAHYEENVFKFNQQMFDDQMITIQDSVHDMTIKRSKVEDAYPCAAGKTSGWVTWDGRLLPCGTANKPVSFPLEKGFASAWEDVKQQCSNVPLSHECIMCELKDFCESCPSRLFNETGAFDKPAPYLCKLAHTRYEVSQLPNQEVLLLKKGGI